MLGKFYPNGKKLISFVLTLAMLLSMFSCMSGIGVFAIDNSKEEGEPVVSETPVAEEPVNDAVNPAGTTADETGHKNHCICGGNSEGATAANGHTHALVNWIGVEKAEDFLESRGGSNPQQMISKDSNAYYYLKNNVTVSIDLGNGTVADTLMIMTRNLNLCLNGYTLTLKNASNVWTTKINICDCSEGQTGKITNPSGGVFVTTNDGSATTRAVNLYGGTVEGSGSGAVIRPEGFAFNMYDGEVKFADSATYYGDMGVLQVRPQNKTATTSVVNPTEVNIYGGDIWGGQKKNTADTSKRTAPAISVTETVAGSTFATAAAKREVNLKGGKIHGGVDGNTGACLRYTTNQIALTIDGAELIGGSAQYGGAVLVSGKNDGIGVTLTMNSGSIHGGNAAVEGGNIYISGGTGKTTTTVDDRTAAENEAKFVLNGGTIDGGTAPTGGNFSIKNGSLNVSGGTIINGRATTTTSIYGGGNIRLWANYNSTTAGSCITSKLEMTGGIIKDGTSGTNGGNICAFYYNTSHQARMLISGGQILGGTVTAGSSPYNNNGDSICSIGGSDFQISGSDTVIENEIYLMTNNSSRALVVSGTPKLGRVSLGIGNSDTNTIKKYNAYLNLTNLEAGAEIGVYVDSYEISGIVYPAAIEDRVLVGTSATAGAASEIAQNAVTILNEAPAGFGYCLGSNGKLDTFIKTDHYHCVCGENCETAIPDNNHNCKKVYYQDLNALAATMTATQLVALVANGGNFYLSDDLQLDSQIVLKADMPVSICYNNHTITYSGTSARPFLANAGNGTTHAYLNLCDCSEEKGGSWVTTATDVNTNSLNSVFNFTNSVDPQINIYGGKIIGPETAKKAGGTIAISGKLTTGKVHDVINIYGGEITGGHATYGGNILLSPNTTDGNPEGNVNMYGGKVYGGVAIGNAAGSLGGGNICVEKATFNMYGGEVYGGQATTGTGTNGVGGNLFTMSTGKFKMFGGTIRDGSSVLNGGNVHNGGTAELNGGVISGGTAVTGASFNNIGTLTINDGAKIIGGTSSSNAGALNTSKICTMNGGIITGGKAGNCGGAVFTSGTFTMNGGVIENTTEEITANTAGGTITFYSNVDINGGIIRGGRSTNSGTIQAYKDCVATIDDAVIECGIAEENGGGSLVSGSLTMNNTTVRGGTFTMSDGVTEITGGVANEAGGLFYIAPVSEFKATNCIFEGGKSNNKASGFSGGNIYVGGGITSTFDGCIIRNGTARFGANLGVGGEATVEFKNTIPGNTSLITGGVDFEGSGGGNGGNVYVENAIANFTDTDITNGNTMRGGNLYVKDSDGDFETVVTVTGGNITGGTAINFASNVVGTGAYQTINLNNVTVSNGTIASDDATKVDNNVANVYNNLGTLNLKGTTNITKTAYNVAGKTETEAPALTATGNTTTNITDNVSVEEFKLFGGEIVSFNNLGESASVAITLNDNVNGEIATVDNTLDLNAETPKVTLTNVDLMLAIDEGKLYAGTPVAAPEDPAITEFTYNGAPQTVQIDENDGYTITDNTKTNVGNYTAKVTLNSGYVWNDHTADVKTHDWSITAKAITSATAASQTYTGSPLDPELTVKSGDTVLSVNDYTVTWEDDGFINAGTYNGTVTGKGNYSFTVDVTFTINKKEISVPTAKTGLVYNGETLKGVDEGEGYELTGNTATDAGEYIAVATIDSNYKWENEGFDGNISWSIAKATVELTELSATEIVEGSKLETSTISGKAMFNGEEVEGTFAWEKPETEVTTSGSFKVIFTPNDTKNFENASADVQLTVKSKVDDKKEKLNEKAEELKQTYSPETQKLEIAIVDDLKEQIANASDLTELGIIEAKLTPESVDNTKKAINTSFGFVKDGSGQLLPGYKYIYAFKYITIESIGYSKFADAVLGEKNGFAEQLEKAKTTAQNLESEFKLVKVNEPKDDIAYKLYIYAKMDSENANDKAVTEASFVIDLTTDFTKETQYNDQYSINVTTPNVYSSLKDINGDVIVDKADGIYYYLAIVNFTEDDFVGLDTLRVIVTSSVNCGEIITGKTVYDNLEITE